MASVSGAPAPEAPPSAAALGHPARNKQALAGEDALRLRTALARQGALPAGKFKPSVMTLEDGRKLFLSNRLESGSYGKYRLGVMDGREWGVKELRTPEQQHYRSNEARVPSTRVTSWAAAAEEIGLLGQAFTDMRAHEVISHRGRLYLLMEPMQGDLDAVNSKMQHVALTRSQRLGVALSALSDASASLARTHEANWVHRDIKPENLFVTPEGRVRVGDVGLAASLADGARLGELSGTPGFIAPELWRGAPASPAADVWSLGMSFANLLTGTHPLEQSFLSGLSLSKRLSLYQSTYQSLPRAPDGMIDVGQLRLGARYGFEGYFARMRRDFGATVTLAVMDFMLHPSPQERFPSDDLHRWAEARLSRTGGAQDAHANLRKLAISSEQRQRQAYALHVFAQDAGDGRGELYSGGLARLAAGGA